MGAQRCRPQTAVRSTNHPARSSAVAVREPGLVDGITRLQQTAGNRATAARLVAVQRDAAKQPGPASSVDPDYDRVYKGYWSLMQDLMHLNAKVVSLIRTDWTDDLGRGLTELGDPATAKPAAIAALDQRLTATRGNIEAEVAAAKAEWKSLWAEYKQERDGLVGGSSTDLEALRLLDLRAKDDQGKVFTAYQYLTFDDIAGLQTMLANKTHVRWATHQDEVEYQRRKKAELAKLPHYKSFRIRTLAGGAVSVGPVGGEVTTVELVEVGGRTGMLTFVAEGLALGFEAGAQGPQSSDRLHHAGTHAAGALRLPGARDQRRRPRHLRRHVLVGHLLPGGAEDGEDRQLRARVGVRRWPLDHRRHLEAALHRLSDIGPRRHSEEGWRTMLP